VIHRLVLAACVAALAVGLADPAEARTRDAVSAAAQTNTLRHKVRTLRRQLARLERQVELMEESAEGYEDWQTCLRYVPVNELGDRDRHSGYLYDERDGTGPGPMDGLAVDRRRPRGREDYLFIHFRGDGCRSDTPQPGGTAEPASVHASAYGRSSLKAQVRMLERKAKRLIRRSQRLETISERFDEWESCVSWVPVTELGDPDRKFGYLFGRNGGPVGYRPALHIDRADWDDPDYMFLALVGGDRPGRRCQDEPGEAVD
jgi:hypothetical protein